MKILFTHQDPTFEMLSRQAGYAPFRHILASFDYHWKHSQGIPTFHFYPHNFFNNY